MAGSVKWAVLFLVSSFLGWVLESTYRSIREHTFIDSGLLSGPFIPIYGVGTLIIEAIDIVVPDQLAWVEVLACIGLCTLLEFLVHLFYEKVFDLKLWDYSSFFLNIQGRVCLLYSFFWGILGYFYLHFLQQNIWWLVNLILGSRLFWILLVCFSIYFVFQVIKNSYELLHIRLLKRNLIGMLESPTSRNFGDVGENANTRILLAFPHILKGELVSLLARIKKRAMSRIGFHPYKKALGIFLQGHVLYEDQEDWQFFLAIEDLLANRKVRSMADIRHHQASVLDHSLVISQASWYLADAFGLDKVSCARGALLHDFFLYDWRKEKHPHHAIRHAGIALENAQMCFDLNEVEKDIILTHMWPLSKTFYRYRESLLVSMIDKIASSKDLISMLKSPK
jgi:uncharacterized membrane protein